MPTRKPTRSPAYQFYPGDFVKDENVLLMTYTEIGIYQILLCHAWTNRGLPTDPAAIAAMLKLPAARFRKIWAGPVGKCFTERHGRFVNPRQEQERQKQEEFRRRQKENGSLGGRKPYTQTEPRPNPVVNPLATQAEARALKTEESTSSLVLRKKEEGHDEAFRVFWGLYPTHRRQAGAFVEQLFLQQVALAGGVEPLLDALRNHVASAQWRAGKVEKMDRWLSQQLWKNTLPATEPTTDATGFMRKPKWATT